VGPDLVEYVDQFLGLVLSYLLEAASPGLGAKIDQAFEILRRVFGNGVFVNCHFNPLNWNIPL
jgi:hypothetical protein